MPQMHLFIDTNVFLNFYHYTNDDIKVIDSLIEHVANGDIVLHLPQQVHNEWERNREVKLRTAATDFRKNPFPDEIPRHMHGMASAKAYQDAVDQAKKARDHLIAEATAKARTYGLEVDVMLSLLFAAATLHPEDDAIFARAKQRAEKGNPPGKNDSVGDQYNWETLLNKVPDEDLYIVTKDGDYVSALGGTDENGGLYPNAFLKREWYQRKGSKNLYIFQTIKNVLAHYAKTLAAQAAPANTAEAPPQPVAQEQPQADALPIVEPAQPVEQSVVEEAANEPEVPPPVPAEVIDAKNHAVESLAESGNFQMAHNAIANLQQFRQFLTVDDANRLIDAALENNQIRWIISDSDVYAFYTWLVGAFFSALDPTLLDNAIELLGLHPDDEGHPETENA